MRTLKRRETDSAINLDMTSRRKEQYVDNPSLKRKFVAGRGRLHEHVMNGVYTPQLCCGVPCTDIPSGNAEFLMPRRNKEWGEFY